MLECRGEDDCRLVVPGRRWFDAATRRLVPPQAQRKLASARWDLEGAFWEDACFSAQQAAELAVKALLQSQGRIELGHSVFQLLQRAEGVPADLLGAARVLDRHYIPARYPNGFPDGAPMDFYDAPTAEEALRCAEAILEFVGARL